MIDTISPNILNAGFDLFLQKVVAGSVYMVVCSDATEYANVLATKVSQLVPILESEVILTPSLVVAAKDIDVNLTNIPASLAVCIITDSEVLIKYDLTLDTPLDLGEGIISVPALVVYLTTELI